MSSDWAIGMSAYGYDRQGMSGGLRMDYVAFIATTSPLITGRSSWRATRISICKSWKTAHR